MQLVEPVHQFAIVLLGEDFRGGHQRRLVARLDRRQHRHHRHHGFARTHIPLHQAVHRDGLLQVGQNVVHHPLLGVRQLKG